MTESSQAADQVVRMTLNGVEVAAKITGAGAKQLAVMLYAILRDQKQTRGKTRLSSMLRSGKELKVFAVKDEDLSRFCAEAKKYGVLYCVLKDRDATDGLTDIMVRAEDASKINRIFDRFQLATVDMGAVKSEMERSRKERDSEQPAPERTAPEKDNEEAFLRELFGDNPNREKAQSANPTMAQTGKSSQSAPTFGSKGKPGRSFSEEPQRRPSVRKELQQIRETQRARAASSKSREKAPMPRQNIHKAPKKKTKSAKER